MIIVMEDIANRNNYISLLTIDDMVLYRIQLLDIYVVYGIKDESNQNEAKENVKNLIEELFRTYTIMPDSDNKSKLDILL